jgi:hypothetical protein
MAEDQALHSVVRSALGLDDSEQPMETNALIRELARRMAESAFYFNENGGLEGLNGSALTDLNADELTTGTVPLARLANITDTEIAAAAAIAWSKISKTGSSLADLTTRSASDLSSGTLPDGRFPATLPAASGANLTNLNATNLASGTVPDARFPATLPAVSAANLTNLDAADLKWGARFIPIIAGTTNAISDAFDNMTEGDIFVLGPGTHTQTEEITIPVGIQRFGLIGMGSAVTEIEYTGGNTRALSMTIDGTDSNRIEQAIVKGIHFRYNNSTTSTLAGLQLWGYHYNEFATPAIVLEDLIFDYGADEECWLTPLSLFTASCAVIDKVRVRREPNGTTGVGIALSSCLNVRITNSSVMCCEKGIALLKASDGLIDGAVLYGCEDVHISNTTIFICDRGIELGYKCFACNITDVETSFCTAFGVVEDISSGTENGGYHHINGLYFDTDTAEAIGVYIARPHTSIINSAFHLSSEDSVNGVVLDTTGSAIGDRCIVQGNHFRDGGLGTPAGAGIVVHTNNNVIAFNTFETFADPDIVIIAGATGNLVTGNQIDDSITDGGTSTTLANNITH